MLIKPPLQENGRPAGRPSYPVGTRRATKDGYIVVKVDEYTWTAEHRIVCEETLGHPLPPLATVYHTNGDVSDNTKSNLVMCEDYGYLAALRARRRIQKLGYNPWLYKFYRGAVRPISEVE